MTTPSHACRCGGDGSAMATAALDLRLLQAPEPMLRALAAAQQLAPGETLEVLTPFMPMPLLAALAERGLHAQASELPQGGAKVVIRYATPGDGVDHGTTGA